MFWTPASCHIQDTKETDMQPASLTFLLDQSTGRQHSPNTPIVRLSGAHDPQSSPALWEEIKGLIYVNGDGIILDASEVTFFDASGVRVLVSAVIEPAARSRRLTVRNPSRCVDRVLRLCGLEASPPTG